MANPTTYYNLLKPAAGETYDVNLLDSNYDLIDAALHGILITPLKADNQLLFTNGGYAWTGGQAWDAGTLSIDNSSTASSQMSSPQPSFASAGSLSGTIKFIQPGIYDVGWIVSPGADPGNSGYQVVMSGTWPGTPGGYDQSLGKMNHNAGSFYWETKIDAIGIRVPTANLEIRLNGQQTNTTTNVAKVKVLQRSKF